MTKNQLLEDYRKPEDKILLSQILEKYRNSQDRNKLEYSDFLDMYQIVLVKNFLKKSEINNYIFYGGFENAERNIVIFYPNGYEENEIKKEYINMCKIIRITLSEEERGKLNNN